MKACRFGPKRPTPQRHTERLFIPLLFITFSFFFMVAPSLAQNGLSLLFSGERRSELESCGCIAQQQGGVQFEAALYRRQESAGAPFLRLDAGGWTDPFVRTQPVSAMKTRYLLAALGGLGFDAVNFARPEMELSAAFWRDLVRRQPQSLAPLLSANVFLASAPESLAFPASRILTRRRADGRDMVSGTVSILFGTVRA